MSQSFERILKQQFPNVDVVETKINVIKFLERSYLYSISGKPEEIAYLKEIDRVLNRMDPRQERILKAKYFGVPQPSNVMLYMSLGLSERSFYRLRNKALIEFAIGYNAGELIVRNH